MAKKSAPRTVSAIAAAPTPIKPTRQYAAQERQWRAEDALRTITRADEIKRDTTLMRDVKSIAKKQVQTLNNITKSGGGK